MESWIASFLFGAVIKQLADSLREESCICSVPKILVHHCRELEARQTGSRTVMEDDRGRQNLQGHTPFNLN